MDAEDQHNQTPPQKKSGPTKPPSSPLFGMKFDEGFSPEHVLEYQHYPKDAALKQPYGVLADGAKDIDDAETARKYKSLAGRIYSLFTQHVLPLERFNNGRDAGVRVAQVAEKDPVKAASPQMLDKIQEKLSSPSPKESELCEQLVQVIKGHKAFGSSISLDELSKGVDAIFFNMKPALLKHKEPFERAYVQILVKLNNAVHSAQKAAKFEEAHKLLVLAQKLDKQYKEYLPLCRAIGHAKTAELYLQKSNPFSGVSEAQWAMVTSMASGSGSHQYKEAVQSILPELAKATAKRSKAEVSRPKRDPPSHSDDGSEHMASDDMSLSGGSEELDRKQSRKRARVSKGRSLRFEKVESRQVVVCGWCKRKGHCQKDCYQNVLP